MSWISEIYFFTVLEAGGPKSGWLDGWILVRALFLACSWPCSYCVLTWQRWGERPSFPWWICSSILSGRHHAYHPNKYSVCSAMAVFLRPHELQPARLLCPWNFPGKDTEASSIPYPRGSSQPRDGIGVSCLVRWTLYHWATWEALRKVWVQSLGRKIHELCLFNQIKF